MQGKICLVTGATSGVGRAIATGLAERGATVVLLSRSAEKGRFASDSIRSRHRSADVEAMEADLSDFSSIRRFADAFQKRYPRLHVLSNNAAVLPMTRRVTADGFESVFGVNYLAHYFLTRLLLERLLESAPARVLTVSGSPGLFRRCRIDFEDILSLKKYNPVSATVRAACAKVAFSLELARRFKGTGVASNTFHPGIVRSNLARELPAAVRPLIRFAEALMKEECRTGVELASSPRWEKTTGCFFTGGKPVRFDADPAVGEKLWDLSERLCGLERIRPVSGLGV